MWILRFYNQYNQELTRLSIKNESSKIYIFSKWKESYHDNHDKDLIYAHVFVTSGKICERPTLKERDREKDACVRVCASVPRPSPSTASRGFQLLFVRRSRWTRTRKKFLRSPDCQIAMRDRKYTDLLTFS